MEANGWVLVLAPTLGTVLALLCLVEGYRVGRRRRLLDNLPTCKTSAIFIGLVELKGTAEAEQPLTSYLAEVPCVHYRWRIEEHWLRTVTETYTDSNGKQQTRTRHESGWKTIDEGGDSTPFYLRDDCGVVRVHPEGARIEARSLLEETCVRGHPLYYGKGPAYAVPDSDHRRRFSEWGIALHGQLYIVGQARERQDVIAPEIAHDAQAALFLISTRSEEKITRGMGYGQWTWFIFAVLVGTGSWLARDAIAGRDLPAQWIMYVGAGLAYLAAAAGFWCWMAYNSLVDLRNRVRQAWSQVEVQLKRRHDLIPNLVSVVSAMKNHEQEVQSDLAALRTQLSATPPGVAGPDYNAVQHRVIALRERYPELKAQAGFRQLERNLVETEQRIALARNYFNDIATHYNTRLETFPEVWVAQLGRMKSQALMTAGEFERASVEVRLAG